MRARALCSTQSFVTAPSLRPLHSFLHYHLARFDHIFLFLDDDEKTHKLVRDTITGAAAATGAAAGVRKVQNEEVDQRVTIIKRDEAAKLHRSCPSYSKLCVLDEISARQILNAEACVELCLKRWDHCWLVHIDADELFFVKDGDTLGAHFEMLDEQGIEQFTYVNYEAIVDNYEREDYFEQTFFKRHHYEVSLTPEARACLQFWTRRTTYEQYFLFYDNGKAAVRCRRGLQALSQHKWANCKTKTSMADHRQLDIDGFMKLSEPLILHFPIGGYNWFRAKYDHLGQFPNKWLGAVDVPSSIHTMARDLPSDELERLFINEVLIEDTNELRPHLDAGVVVRIHALNPEQTEEEQIGEESHTITTTSATQRHVGDSQNAMGLDKGWILANCVREYL